VKFSWKKGALHAGLAALVVVGVGIVLSAAGVAKDPEKLGEGIGRLALFVVLGALGMSVLFQTGRRRMAWALIGVAGVVVAAVVGVALLARRTGEVPLTPVEKRPLVDEMRDGQRWLVSSALGFAVRHPGKAFTPMPRAMVAGAFGADVDASGDAFVDADHGAVVMLLVTSMAPASSDDLEAMAKGIRRGLEKSLGALTAGKELATLRDEVAWRDGDGQVHLHRSDGTVHLHVDGWRGIYGGHPRTVVLVAFTTEGDALSGMANSFRRL
jgi:hypothetical protein